MLFSDKAEGCTAVREAFLLLLSHYGGGREGRKEMAIFIWQWCGRLSLLYLCWFDNLSYCFYVISFVLVYQNPEMAGQKKVCCGGMICFLNKHELQLND